MKSIKARVEYFLEDFIGSYLNPHGVEILLNSDSSVFLATLWPEVQTEESVTIELIVDLATLDEFITLFGIVRVADLGHITPYLLLALYRQEKAEVCVSLDGANYYYPLYFRRH